MPKAKKKPEKAQRKTPGKKPETLKIDLEPEQALQRLLRPKSPEQARRKSGS